MSKTSSQSNTKTFFTDKRKRLTLDPKKFIRFQASQNPPEFRRNTAQTKKNWKLPSFCQLILEKDLVFGWRSCWEYCVTHRIRQRLQFLINLNGIERRALSIIFQRINILLWVKVLYRISSFCMLNAGFIVSVSSKPQIPDFPIWSKSAQCLVRKKIQGKLQCSLRCSE